MEEEINKRRNKNWATIVYRDSAPKNWIEILDRYNVPALISPLHDKDKNEDGSFKKEHYHIIITFDGQKTRAQAKAIFDSIGGVGAENIESIKGYSRYLCHLDNPEKAQYNPKDVITLSGANYDFLIEMPRNKYKIIGEIMDYCIENNICSYAYILSYAKNNQLEWFYVLCDNSHTITQFLKSISWSKKNEIYL